MKRNLKALAMLVGVIGASVFVWFITNEWNRAAFGSRGFIEDGKKFGIEIGQSRDLAIADLEGLGLMPHRLSKNSCYGREYESHVELDLLRDISWRRGSICIGSISGKVTSVSWFYGMFQP